MHILFVHQNFPAQFGHIARHLMRQGRFRCSFATARAVDECDGINIIPYQPVGGATRHNSYLTRTFENAVAHARGVHDACRRASIRPDLVVAHSGFGSSLFLREVFQCPIVNYFEYFYHAHDSDLDFRPDLPPAEQDVLRAYCRNAMLLLDLDNCDAGYAPTAWQRSRFPLAYQGKLDVIFDGIDLDIWQRHAQAPRRVQKRDIPSETKIVTYVARGLEAMRGFDIFMRAAKRIYQQHPNVTFVVVGTDRVAYGGDERVTRGQSFREYLLSQDDYDLSKFHFTGWLPPRQLAELLSITDVHVYLTVPFVLSWSLFNALACGATVVASDTPPVQELITHGRNGLLVPFFDTEELASQVLEVLRDPRSFHQLGENGRHLIADNYSLAQTLPKTIALYQRITSSLAKG